MAAHDYWEKSVLVPFLVWAMAALGLNILTGYCGQVSLGTGGFMAVGAYACYKLMTAFPELNMFSVVILAGTTLGGVIFRRRAVAVSAPTPQACPSCF